MDESMILSEVVAAASQVFERAVDEGDDFFEIGGDSVNAIELLERLEDRFKLELDPAIVYEAEDFRMLAKRIGELNLSLIDGGTGNSGA